MDKINTDIQRYRLLAANLLKYDRVGHPGELTDLFRVQVIERMRRDQQRQAVDLQVFSGQAAGREKCG